MPISANYPAEVAPLIIESFLRRRCEPSWTHKVTVDPQMRPLERPVLLAGDVLPASVRQESVVAAGDEFRPVLERDPVGRLDRRPMGQDLRRHVPTVLSVEGRTVDGVPDSHLSQRLRATVGHKDRSVALEAVNTCMQAPSVDVDGPFEAEAAGGGDVVEDRLGLDLVEGDVAELGGVEGADGRGRVEQRQVGRGPLLPSQVTERPHRDRLEHLFDEGNAIAGAAEPPARSLGQPVSTGSDSGGWPPELSRPLLRTFSTIRSSLRIA